MVSAKTLLNYPYWTTPFTVHTDAYDKQFDAIISKNNRPIPLLSRRLRNLQRNYTATEKEILAIGECLKQFHRILFGYVINIFSYHKIWSMPQP